MHWCLETGVCWPDKQDDTEIGVDVGNIVVLVALEVTWIITDFVTALK